MSSARRVYLDTGVLISAFRGEDELANRALEVLDDPDVCLVLSEYVRLEVLPKPIFHKNLSEERFLQEVIGVSECIESTREIRDQAFTLACTYNLNTIDALHVSAAIAAKVDEIITLENSTKPMCNVREIVVRSLRDAG